MEAVSVLAMVGGFAVPAVLAARIVVDLGRAWHASKNEDADYLELFVNGKDYSIELKSITNGGSERIHKARLEMERCD